MAGRRHPRLRQEQEPLDRSAADGGRARPRRARQASGQQGAAAGRNASAPTQPVRSAACPAPVHGRGSAQLCRARQSGLRGAQEDRDLLALPVLRRLHAHG